MTTTSEPDHVKNNQNKICYATKNDQTKGTEHAAKIKSI
jgi:hypothetical protein